MTTKRSLISSSRSYSSPATYSPTLLIIFTRTFLLLPSPFVEARHLGLPVPADPDDLFLGVEPLGEEVGLLGAHLQAAEVAALGPGVLVRLEASDLDVARPHPLDVLTLEDEAVVPHHPPSGGDRDLVGRLDLERDHGRSPALIHVPSSRAPGAAASASCAAPPDPRDRRRPGRS